ncbi:MAG: CehA/McbA family metallohydrolase [Fuerstiella sp.]|nr:CehA/McbA family metallohydrolase [Fuerstiella sp.]MCP4857037.1 CehA/McbA family metallohydrolase [Fuerstiella sp.]
MLSYDCSIPKLLALVVGVIVQSHTTFAGTLELQVVDDNDTSIPCRVLILKQDGGSVVPGNHTTLNIDPQRWFVIDGQDSLDLPDGQYTLRVERGMEYTRYKKRLRVSSPETNLQVTLSRWADMKERGYASGENHIHVPVSNLPRLLAAEALDYGSTLTWWNGARPKTPVPDGPEHQRRMKFAGHNVAATVFDAEIEHPWGAVYIQNLPAPLPFVSDPKRPNLDALQHAVDVGATVHYQAGWSREVALDALLGKVHVVNVCNNNFHQHQYQLRSIYSNLLQTPGLETYENTEQGMLRMNNQTYYRLLNWGLKIAAGAGSASGVKPSPVGYNRAYVRTDPDGSIDQFYDNWKAGRNFVTNGPLLFLSAGQNKRPGDSIAFKQAGGQVHLTVSVMSRQPLTSVEIVVNGEVAHAFDLNERNVFQGETNVTITEGSWIAARCTSRDGWLTEQQLSVFTSGKDTDRFTMRPSRLRFAHTSPIYVTVSGHGAAVPESIKEGLRMMDRLEVFSGEQASAERRGTTLKAINQARTTLQEKLATATGAGF